MLRAFQKPALAFTFVRAGSHGPPEARDWGPLFARAFPVHMRGLLGSQEHTSGGRPVCPGPADPPRPRSRARSAIPGSVMTSHDTVRVGAFNGAPGEAAGVFALGSVGLEGDTSPPGQNTTEPAVPAGAQFFVNKCFSFVLPLWFISRF